MPVPTIPIAQNVQNDEGLYMPTQFGWLFIRSKDIVSHKDLKIYEQAANANALNLAQSENVATGRVTFAMVDDPDPDMEAGGGSFGVPTKDNPNQNLDKKEGEIKVNKAGVSI